MNKLTPVLLFLLLPIFALTQSCPCAEQFDWVRTKLALNYSGYRDKVTPQNQEEFDRYTADYQSKMAMVSADTTCLRLMAEWARWFRDGHVQLSLKSVVASDDPEEIRRRFAVWEKIALTEAEARTYLDQPGRDPVEGIYQIAGGSYTVALVRNVTPQRDFAAVILKADSVWWMPGQVKFELKQTEAGKYNTRFFMRDHSERNPAASYDEGKLDFAELGPWYKQYPGAPLKPARPQIFTLAYPTSRSCRVAAGKPIDGVGIPPDLRLDEKENDWVDFARKYLKGE